MRVRERESGRERKGVNEREGGDRVCVKEGKGENGVREGKSEKETGGGAVERKRERRDKRERRGCEKLRQ